MLPSFITEVPPPPPGPQIAKDLMLMFSHMKNLVCIVVPYCTYVSSVMRYS